MKDFTPHVHGVTYFNEEPRVREIQEKAQNFCKWDRSDFPGSQPVSMDLKNLHNLSKKPYRVSWKADGVRYLYFASIYKIFLVKTVCDLWFWSCHIFISISAEI